MKRRIEVKLWDKGKSLDRLMRWQGMYKDKLQLQGEIIAKTGVLIAPAPIGSMEDWMKIFSQGRLIDARKGSEEE